MLEGEYDKVFGGAGDKLRNVTDSELCEDGSFIDQSKEEEEQQLQRRNEEFHKLNRAGANGIGSVSMPAEKGTRKSICRHGWLQGQPNPGLEGTSVMGTDPQLSQIGQQEKKLNVAKSFKNYFNMRAERRKEEEQHWEEIGDEDLIGNVKGKFGFKRIFWKGSLDSQGCPTASSVIVKDIFRHCVRILGAYGNSMDELVKPIRRHEPHFDCKGVVDLQQPTGAGECPPYFVYVDHEYKEVSVYIRGLNLLHRRDYVALMNNRKGEEAYDGGYVHHGMFGPAQWAVKHIGPVLNEQLRSNNGYRLRIVGHSLGAGVAALLTVFLLNNLEVLGNISPDRICAFVFAPPRVMSLDLAIKYAPHINSVVYQDDFLPRVSTKSVKRVFLLTFAITGAVVFIYWLRQAFQSRDLKDTRRLYPPGKIFHFVYKQPGRPGHRPIRARVVPSAEGRFERLVLSSSGTATNHSVLKLTKHLKSYNWPEELKDSWLTSVLQTGHS